ncbi:MAG: serine hydrolase domain-containing protein [Desulfobacterales bacterium]|jgi:CubicO group peptidase (beta-lactamase class C family)
MPPSSLPNESIVHQLMQQALDEGVFPGAVLLVAREGNILLHRAWGTADLFSARPVGLDTVFDLASLTKPLATALAVMRLVETGRLVLDTPMAAILPTISARDKARVTVRHLLSHCSGWPAWQPYFERLREHPAEARRPLLTQYLADEPLVAKPGMVHLYSDLDFLALGLLVEACTGVALDRYVRQEIYRPLGIEDLFFNPLDAAHVLNGVAGHAGLFGTAAAVYALLESLLASYYKEALAVPFSSHLVRTFWTRARGSTWALGFDSPSRPTSSSGQYFSANSIGHLGFTGTSFWTDIERRITIVLLTNRIHPSRSNELIRIYRPRIHDAVMRDLLDDA